MNTNILKNRTSEERKKFAISRGVLGYFPDAIAALAYCSYINNEKHNPGEELHWARGKSDDHADCLIRHHMEHGTLDPDDNIPMSVKALWRAAALCQLDLERMEKEGTLEQMFGKPPTTKAYAQYGIGTYHKVDGSWLAKVSAIRDEFVQLYDVASRNYISVTYDEFDNDCAFLTLEEARKEFPQHFSVDE